MSKFDDNILNLVESKLVPHVLPPNQLLKPLKMTNKLLMIPGPTNISSRVSAVSSIPIVSHLDPQFFEVLREVSEGIRYVFQTQNQYSLAITGSATCAMETAICNLVERGETLLTLVHGLWGQRVALIGAKHGFNVIKLQVDQYGNVLDIKQIEKAIKAHKPKLVYVCHGDSSTGTLQPLDNIGLVCHQNNCLLLVDAVVSLCCSPINMDNMQIDAIFSGSQKALSGPPGLSLLSLSDRAVDVIKNRKTDIDSFYMDIKWLSKAWGIDNNDSFIYHYTPAMSLIYGLREALALVAEEGLANVIARHVRHSLKVQQELKQMGLQFLVNKPEYRLPGILSIVVPNNIDGEQVRQYLYDCYDISIAGGMGPTVGKIWRIGILGVNANPRSVAILCQALNEAINDQKNRSFSKL